MKVDGRMAGTVAIVSSRCQCKRATRVCATRFVAQIAPSRCRPYSEPRRCNRRFPSPASPTCQRAVGIYFAASQTVILFEEISMPEKKTLEAAQEDKREGKAPTTQAGEFVKEEMHHVREGKHGARNPKQAIAIGLSKARRSGVRLPAPGKEQSAETRKKAAKDSARGRKPKKKISAKRS